MAYEPRHHKVKIHHWVDGILHNLEYEFKSFEEAFHFARNTDADTVKVLNSDDEVIHVKQSTPNTGSYADGSYA
jgi:hypothetical protein